MTDRLWSKVDTSAGLDGCWPWTGTTNRNGYGRLWVNRRWATTHRLVYERLVEPIPEGLTLDHLCRNRACCNPTHLEPVTNRENVLRGVGLSATAARRMECRRGHPYDGLRRDGDQTNRYCRTCNRMRQRGQLEATA
jgi:hypothetical protein